MYPNLSGAVTAQRAARLKTAMRWGALGAVAEPVAWLAVYGLSLLGLDSLKIWERHEVDVTPATLTLGLTFGIALALALRQGGHAGTRTVIGFALLAAPYWIWARMAGEGIYFAISSNLLLIGFAGGLAASAWLTGAGLLLFPCLRRKRTITGLLGAGGISGALLFWGESSLLVPWYDGPGPFTATGWQAIYAAALSITLPLPGERDGTLQAEESPIPRLEP